MSNFHISVNQLAEFSASSDAAKARIVAQQVKPNGFLVPWYSSAKAAMRKYLINVRDTSPLQKAIEIQRKKVPATKRQKNEQTVSILALERFIEMKLHQLLKGIEYEIIKPERKAVIISDVNISVLPETVIRAKINGKIVLGGIKIHISKNKPFERKQCQYIAALVYQYIRENYAKSGEIVDPSLCISIDVFGDRIVSASKNRTTEIQEIKQICKEIKAKWPTK
jgi:hypothetical protein